MTIRTRAIAIDTDVYARLETAAKERVIGVGLLAEWAIADYLNRIIPIELLRPHPHTIRPEDSPTFKANTAAINEAFLDGYHQPIHVALPDIVPTPVSLEDGRPVTTRREGSNKDYCGVCTNGAGGFGRQMPWIEKHREHVKCSCGAIVTKRGHAKHAAALRGSARKAAARLGAALPIPALEDILAECGHLWPIESGAAPTFHGAPALSHRCVAPPPKPDDTAAHVHRCQCGTLDIVLVRRCQAEWALEPDFDSHANDAALHCFLRSGHRCRYPEHPTHPTEKSHGCQCGATAT